MLEEWKFSQGIGVGVVAYGVLLAVGCSPTLISKIPPGAIPIYPGNCATFMPDNVDAVMTGGGWESSKNSTGGPFDLRLYKAKDWQGGDLTTGKWVGAAVNQSNTASDVFPGLMAAPNDTGCVFFQDAPLAFGGPKALLHLRGDTDNNQGTDLPFAQVCVHAEVLTKSQIDALHPLLVKMTKNVCPSESEVRAAIAVRIGVIRSVAVQLPSRKNVLWTERDVIRAFRDTLTAVKGRQERLLEQGPGWPEAVRALGAQFDAGVKKVQTLVTAQGAWYPCGMPVRCCKAGS